MVVVLKFTSLLTLSSGMLWTIGTEAFCRVWSCFLRSAPHSAHISFITVGCVHSSSCRRTSLYKQNTITIVHPPSKLTMNSLYGMSTNAHAPQYATFRCLLLARDFCGFATLDCTQPPWLASSLTKKQLQPMRFLPEEWGCQPSKHNYFKFNVQFPKENPVWWNIHTAGYLKLYICCTFMFKMRPWMHKHFIKVLFNL